MPLEGYVIPACLLTDFFTHFDDFYHHKGVIQADVTEKSSDDDCDLKGIICGLEILNNQLTKQLSYYQALVEVMEGQMREAQAALNDRKKIC